MLRLLRNKAQSTFIQIIVVIIALVFIFWGVGTNMMGSREAALVVNGKEISFQEFQQAYDRAYQRLSDQFGGNVPKGMAETLGIKQQVINQLVQTSLLRQGADEMGLVISGDEVHDIINEMVQFQESGSFNLTKYKTLLASNRLTPTKFEASIRYDKLSETAVREINNFVTVASDFEIEDIFNQINREVSLDYVKVSPSQFTGQVKLDDKILAEWFETVKEKYKTEPQLKLKYLAFTYDLIGKKIEIDDAKAKAYYEANLNSYKVAEQRHARHILFEAKESDNPALHKEKSDKAKEVLQLARNGADFSELAKQYSEGPSKDSGGDLGFFEKGSMVPKFDSAVFSMKPGQISEIIKTRFGYHIILLEEVKPATARSFEEVRDSIITTLQKKEAENIAFQVANSAYEGIIGAGSLDSYAKNNPDAEIEETDFFTRSTPLGIFAKDPAFLDKAFALNKGELSSLIKGKSGYAIFYAEDVIEPDFPPFEDVKDRLQKDFRKVKSEEMAKEGAERLLADIHSEKELKAAAAEQGLELIKSEYLSKRKKEQNGSFPEELLSQVFLLSSKSPFPEEPGKVGEDYYVYKFLASRTP
ncbi:MAG: SurA N-terminal domain-containing protein, partial [Deltaproteobacteria bacterium]|nr:SurA N-terminal domain-containing protein [Deltaproteobacteria bacterium]